MKIGIFVLLILLAFASEKRENDSESVAKSEQKIKENNAEIFVKIEEDEYVKENRKTSKYIGVTYNKRDARWYVQRWNKNEKKIIHNGCYKDEETAAQASDTLSRKLMVNGEQNQTLNFPDEDTEVYPEEIKTSSKYVGVCYQRKLDTWAAQRWSKTEKTMVSNGSYDDEETAAHASDTLARKLIANGEKNHKLNFPDENTEVHTEKKISSSKYIGVSYQMNKKQAKWRAQRRSKKENKMLPNGYYKDEETAAHASDTLARKLMANGECGHKLNFPDNKTEVYTKERKSSSKYIGVCYNNDKQKWRAQRWSKNESTVYFNGQYKDEETAAHASDNLARKLMTNGEQNHKLNFPDDGTGEHQRNKRKRSDHKDFGYSQNE